MLGLTTGQVGATSVVEQREREVRLEDRVADFGGVEDHLHGERAASPPAGTTTAGRSPAFFRRRTVANASAPTSSEKSRSPALIVTRHLDGQHMGDRAADARVATPGRRSAETLRQALHGVVVLPGLRVDDVDALPARRAPRTRSDPRRPRPRGPLVPTCPAAQVPDHRWRPRRIVGVPGVAGDADDAGGAGVGAHRTVATRSVRRATCRAWRSPGRR